MLNVLSSQSQICWAWGEYVVPYILDAYLHRWNWLQRRRCFNIRARNGQDDLEFGTSYKKSPIPYQSSAADSIPAGKLSVLETHRHGDVPRLFERTLTMILGAISESLLSREFGSFKAECVSCPCWSRQGTFWVLPAMGATVDTGRRLGLSWLGPGAPRRPRKGLFITSHHRTVELTSCMVSLVIRWGTATRSPPPTETKTRV